MGLNGTERKFCSAEKEPRGGREEEEEEERRSDDVNYRKIEKRFDFFLFKK